MISDEVEDVFDNRDTTVLRGRFCTNVFRGLSRILPVRVLARASASFLFCVFRVSAFFASALLSSAARRALMVLAVRGIPPPSPRPQLFLVLPSIRRYFFP